MSKTAAIVGGSNGIGLAIAADLIEKDYFVEIIDRLPPEAGTLREGAYRYRCCDLLNFDEDLFLELARSEEVGLLMITAGIGRVADFEYFHTSEIEKTLMIDTVSTLKILRIFYDKIKNNRPFYCGVMGSISGWVSSPMFAVYAAAKAAICRFVESVNIELEAAGIHNRILNVSPGSIQGTRFNGGQNDLAQTMPLAAQITERLLRSDELFIPQYDEIFKGVIEQYQQDPHQYGLHSYQYKKTSGRVRNERKALIGYLSGTFDLFHIGHLNLLRRAKQQCDYLIVGVHDSGAWKGKETFISLSERKAIVAACKYVDKVVDSCREDSDAWALWHYNRLFVGSDYQGTERFQRYEEFFKGKGVEIVYFPYTQTTSSTQLRKALTLKTQGS